MICGATIRATAATTAENRPAIDEERDPAGGAESRRHPPDLSRSELCRRHGRKLRRQPETGCQREHGEGRKSPEHALAPIDDAAGKLAHGDEQQREADSGDDIGGKREGGPFEAVLRRPAFAVLMLGCASGIFVRGRRRRLCLLGLLEHLSLEDERHRGELLGDRHAEAGDQTDDGGENNDVAEIIHDAPPLVAGKGHGMAIVVARIVHRLDVGEAHAADDENAEQRRHDKRNGASSRQFRDAVGSVRSLGR